LRSVQIVEGMNHIFGDGNICFWEAHLFSMGEFDSQNILPSRFLVVTRLR
jgi:hypothetical protein